MSGARTLELSLAAALLAFSGCGSEEAAPTTRASASTTTTTTASPPAATEDVAPARCPSGLAGCVSASGTIVYVERVDPDGDGDAHFVLASRDSVTAPGVTVVDVRADLRPDPLPGPGDRLAAAGPVFRGSYGQRQIQAEVVSVAR